MILICFEGLCFSLSWIIIRENNMATSPSPICLDTLPTFQVAEGPVFSKVRLDSYILGCWKILRINP